MKFLKIEVSRSESTDIFLRVPDEFDENKLRNHWQMREVIEQAVKETITDGEWSGDDRIEVQGWGRISDEEAAGYLGFDLETRKLVGRFAK